MGRVSWSRRRLVGAAAVLAATLAFSAGVAGLASTQGPLSGGEVATDGMHAASRPNDLAMAADAAEARNAAVRLLATRSAALAARDRSAWESTVAEPESAEGARQRSEFDNLVALGVRELSASVVSGEELAPTMVSASEPSPTDVSLAEPTPTKVSAGAPNREMAGGGTSAHTVTVALAHAIPGFDRQARVATRTVTVTLTEDGWRVARSLGATDQRQAWDLPQLRVVRSATTLVVGNVERSVLLERLADADAAQSRLAGVFGTAAGAVLVVPASTTEAERQLGRPEGSLGQVAASTDGQVGPNGTAVADRVVLNPLAFEKLTAEGRRVVIAHELTHVATRATTAATLPLWLSEGAAEYVAWAPVTMPVQTAAAALLAKVRSESGGPASAGLQLPESSDFDPARPDLATAYQASWLAVRKIALDYGQDKLWAFYRAVAGAPGAPAVAMTVDEAFRFVLGTTAADFVERWRADVEDLAR